MIIIITLYIAKALSLVFCLWLCIMHAVLILKKQVIPELSKFFTRDDPHFEKKLLAHITRQLRLIGDAISEDEIERSAAKLLVRHKALGGRDLQGDSSLFDYAGKINRFVKNFADAGLDCRAYVGACIKQPQLFYQSPETLTKNVDEMVQLFTKDGLDYESWIASCVAQPSLFYQSPKTLEKNIDDVVVMFEEYGLDRATYLAACIKQPTLFYQSPDTVGRHIHYMMAMVDLGILSQDKMDQTSGPYADLFQKMMKYPVTMGLADDNFILRMDYAMLAQEKPHQPNGFSLLLRNKSKIKRLYREKTGGEFALDQVNPVLQEFLENRGLWPQDGSQDGLQDKAPSTLIQDMRKKPTEQKIVVNSRFVAGL